VVPRIGWNATPALTQVSSPLPLIDNTGNVSGATVTWKCDSLSASGIADNQGNFRLMNGNLDTPTASPVPRP